MSRWKWLRKRYWRLKFFVQEKIIRFCHFCGREPTEVRYLVAGPKVFICDSCIVLAADICTAALKEQAEKFKAAANAITDIEGEE